MAPTDKRARARLATQVTKAAGKLTTVAVARMDDEFPWFADLTAQSRSFVGLIVQRGIVSFADWLREPDPLLVANVGPFEVAPRDMAGIVNLHQTVALVKLTFAVVEDSISDVTDPAGAALMHAALLEYGREVAFATAEVYARAAEQRGAWDARLEALLVDSVMRAEADETVRTRASALGWESRGEVVVVLGRLPSAATTGHAQESVIDDVRRSAHEAGMDALIAVQGDRLVAVLGGVKDPDKAGASVASHFGDGPIVVGPLVNDLLNAHISARAAVAGLRAAPGWPDAPRPVTSDDLLPERALAGDGHARRALVHEVFVPLVEAGIVDTVSTFLANGSSIEATARALFVHANTVRYRLRRAGDVTGLSPNDARHAYTFRLALTLGRLQPPETSTQQSL
ncbi:MAG TPA: helix-turn-helix domain-containing protein [Nocardioidaceae bacterium]|nr:helix-turn-helix domain-containing protein [Nocardioidaceae bacterium]